MKRNEEVQLEKRIEYLEEDQEVLIDKIRDIVTISDNKDENTVKMSKSNDVFSASRELIKKSLFFVLSEWEIEENDSKFLEKVLQEWEKFEESICRISELFSVIPELNKSCESIIEIGWGLWIEVFLSSTSHELERMKTNEQGEKVEEEEEEEIEGEEMEEEEEKNISNEPMIIEKIISQILKYIENARKGQTIVDVMIIRKIIQKLQTPFMESIYEEFEVNFLKKTDIYVSIISTEIEDKKLSDPEIYENLRDLLKKEKEMSRRCSYYQRSFKKIETLIFSEIVEKRESFDISDLTKALLENKNIIELRTLFQTLIPFGEERFFKTLPKDISKQVEREGLEILENYKPEEQVDQFIYLIQDYKMMKTCFMTNPGKTKTPTLYSRKKKTKYQKEKKKNEYEKAVDIAFNNLINKKSIEFSEDVSKHIHEKFIQGKHRLEKQEMSEYFDRVCDFLCYFKEKDIFENYFKIDLAKRLLSPKINLRIELEKLFVSKMRKLFGKEFTKKMEIMNNDYVNSTELSREFGKEFSEKNGFEFSIFLLTTGNWPIANRLISYATYIKPPVVLKNGIDCFTKFYKSKSKDRSLVWPAMGELVVLMNGFSKPYRLRCSYLQSLVLLQFNDKKILTLGEIIDNTGMTEKDVVHVFHNLTRMDRFKNMRIINKEKTKYNKVTLDTKFQANEKYEQKSIYRSLMNLNLPQGGNNNNNKNSCSCGIKCSREKRFKIKFIEPVSNDQKHFLEEIHDLELGICRRSTIRNLKEKIQENTKNKFHSNNQYLRFKFLEEQNSCNINSPGKPFSDDKRIENLMDYGIIRYINVCSFREYENAISLYQPTNGDFKIYGKTLEGVRLGIMVSNTDTIEVVKWKLRVSSFRRFQSDFYPTEQQRLVFKGSVLRDEKTIGFYDEICEGSAIQMILQLRGGKPVILIYPKKELMENINVKLSLNKKYWNLSHYYPKVEGINQTNLSKKNEILWKLKKLRKNGIMKLTQNNKKVPYLFWESLTTNNNIFQFDFQEPVFCIKKELSTYFVEKYLSILKFKEKDVCDFITYWISELEEKNFVFIQFMERKKYQKLVSLDLEVPSVEESKIEHFPIFMLFSSVFDPKRSNYHQSSFVMVEREEEIEKSIVKSKAISRVIDWSKSVVLVEWGGMNIS